MLSEGWAESQSKNCNELISRLTNNRIREQPYSLQELVGPDWYGRSSGPVYWEGGPLVLFLFERYSPEVFFQLYSNSRHDSFFDDCQSILGDTWETVENEFRAWVESEASAIREASLEQLPAVSVEFAESVDPEDWHALVAGYRDANTNIDSLPINVAFLVEYEFEWLETKEDADQSRSRGQNELRAVFEGKQFWVICSDMHHEDRFMMATKKRCAQLKRKETGVMTGWVKGHHAYSNVRSEVVDLLRPFSLITRTAEMLPFKDITSLRGCRWRIDEICRPEDELGGSWSISFSRRLYSSAQVQIELDPTQRWWMTRCVVESPGKSYSESDYQYQHLGDSLLPLSVSHKTQSLSNEDYTTRHVRLRPLTESEEQGLRKRVEQVVQTGPTSTDPKPHYQALQHFLLMIVIVWPLTGAALLGFSRHSVTAP